jgi:hypothetical protein
MGKQLLAIFLCVTLTLPFSGKLYVAIDFALHQDTIAATQCENRDKPELACNGKCVLMQKLQLKDSKDSSTPVLPELLRMEVSQFTYSDSSELSFELNARFQETPFPNVNEGLVKPFATSVFHPPRLV